MFGRLRPQVANGLTVLRVLLAPAFVALVFRAGQHLASGLLAVVVFAAAAASDVWDGRIARHLGSDSGAGRILDHFADIAFILVALSAYVWLGEAPWWVPASIAASFVFYVVDSWLRAPVAGSLIGSRIGHAAGVLNYSLIGVLVCNNTARIHLLSANVLRLLFWLVPIYSAAAVATRLDRHRLSLLAPDSPSPRGGRPA